MSPKFPALVLVFMLSLKLCFAQADPAKDICDVRPGVGVRVGDKAPEFNITIFDGTEFSLADNIGKKSTMIVFWSFFCFPCQREMPQLQEFWSEMGEDRLSVVGISLDGPDYDKFVLPFLKENGITFPNGYDTETKNFYKIAEDYGVVGTPTVFLLDQDNRVRFIHLGKAAPTALREIVKGLDDQTFCAEIIKPDAASAEDLGEKNKE